MPQIYLRFLNLSNAIRGLPAIPVLAPLEERLLDGLAELLAAGQEVTLRQAMHDVSIAQKIWAGHPTTSERIDGQVWITG